MTSLKLDPPPFSKVSLALPAPPSVDVTPAADGPSTEIAIKTPAERRPSRFEVVKAPEMYDNSIADDTPQGPPHTPHSVQSNETEDVRRPFLFCGF